MTTGDAGSMPALQPVGPDVVAVRKAAKLPRAVLRDSHHLEYVRAVLRRTGPRPR